MKDISACGVGFGHRIEMIRGAFKYCALVAWRMIWEEEERTGRSRGHATSAAKSRHEMMRA